MDRFILEIYEPGESGTVLASLESSVPPPLAVGDLIQTGALDTGRPNRALAIARIEHSLWSEAGALTHKRMVFTA